MMMINDDDNDDYHNDFKNSGKIDHDGDTASYYLLQNEYVRILEC